jgi:hypothetical protein
MKNIAFYKILICFGLLWLTYSCEKSTDQTSTGNVASNGQLTSRWITDCEDCTDHDKCCCGVELQNPTSDDAYISICGTADGSGTCSFSPPSPCSAISGGGQSSYLYLDHPKEGFCMTKGNSFAITNTGSVNAYVKITCHYDIVSPTYTYLTIPPNTTYYFGADSSCDLFQCNH